MTKPVTNQTIPSRQSAALLLASLAATAAAATACAIYAVQSASPSQAILGIPTDAALKTVMAVVADLGVCFGAIVAAWLWRTGRKGLRKQAIFAMVMTAFATAAAVGNLGGYFAWTNGQHVADVTKASPLYPVALEHARLEAAHPGVGYLSSRDRDMLEKAQVPDTAHRTDGDTLKALGIHLLILGFGAAYRLPAPRKARKAKVTKRSAAKPKLVVSN